MKCTAADYIREMLIPEIVAFSDVVTKRLLPTFDSFGKEAVEHGENWFRARSENLNPLEADEYEAASYLADKAMNKTFVFADTLSGMCFASTGLFTMGLFHLFEQQMADLPLELLQNYSYGKEITLQEVIAWLRCEMSVDITTFTTWRIVAEELRLVANTIKHAEGDSATKLREIRADLFVHPAKREDQSAVVQVGLRIRKPLFGEDVYLTVVDFSRYSDAIVRFWSDLASALARRQ
jgi:hypothetical protein